MATTAITGKTPYTTKIENGNHQMWADEPQNAGGQDEGPSPIGYLEAAIASCSTITMRMYADRKGWELDEVQVTIERRQDAANKETIMAKSVEIRGNLDAKQTQRLIDIGGRCPVIRLVANNVKIVHVD